MRHMTFMQVVIRFRIKEVTFSTTWFDLNFYGQHFKILISPKLKEIVQKWPAWLLWMLIFAIERHYCEYCTYGPWPKFSRSYFSIGSLNNIGWKMQTWLLPLDKKSGICHRMMPLRMLYIMTLNYIFKVTNFEMWQSRKR